MRQPHDLFIDGLPDTLPEDTTAVYSSKLLTIVGDLLKKAALQDIKITVGTASLMKKVQQSS